MDQNNNKINVAVYHKLSAQEALERSKKLLEEVKTSFSGYITNSAEIWADYAASFRISFSVDMFLVKISGEAAGAIIVRDDYVQVYTTEISQQVVQYKDRIEARIHSELNKLLNS